MILHGIYPCLCLDRKHIACRAYARAGMLFSIVLLSTEGMERGRSQHRASLKISYFLELAFFSPKSARRLWFLRYSTTLVSSDPFFSATLVRFSFTLSSATVIPFNLPIFVLPIWRSDTPPWCIRVPSPSMGLPLHTRGTLSSHSTSCTPLRNTFLIAS